MTFVEAPCALVTNNHPKLDLAHTEFMENAVRPGHELRSQTPSTMPGHDDELVEVTVTTGDINLAEGDRIALLLDDRHLRLAIGKILGAVAQLLLNRHSGKAATEVRGHLVVMPCKLMVERLKPRHL